MVARAHELQAENMADEVIEISDDGSNDWMIKDISQKGTHRRRTHVTLQEALSWMIRARSAAVRISRGAARYARTGCAATAWCFARDPDRAALGPATREACERAKTRRQPVWARSSIAGTARSVVPTLTVNSVINCSAHRERSFGNTTANDANALRAVSRVTTR